MRRLLLTLALLCASGVLAQPVGQPLYHLVLPGVPLVHQGYNACGPATLQMTLAYWGLALDQSVISRYTRASSSSYMTAQAIVNFAPLVGLEGRLFIKGNIASLRAALMQGVPVITLSWVRQPGDVAHWRLVVGFDDAKRVLYVMDPLLGYVAFDYDDYQRLWNGQRSEFALVYPPAWRTRVAHALGV